MAAGDVTLREMAIVEALEARIAELEAALSTAIEWMEDVGDYPEPRDVCEHCLAVLNGSKLKMGLAPCAVKTPR